MVTMTTLMGMVNDGCDGNNDDDDDEGDKAMDRRSTDQRLNHRPREGRNRIEKSRRW